jgi:L-fuconolactonase
MIGMVDSHQHFWRLDRGDYGWLTQDLAPIYRDSLPEHLAPQLARARVAATIAVQAAPTVAETRFLLDLARANSFIGGVVGWADLEHANAAENIAGLAEDANLVGLRPMIQDIADPQWMLRQELDAAYEAMIDHGLVFDALVRTEHLRALGELAARYPDLIMVLDHGAKPPIATGDVSEWKREITTLARSTQMVCKLSGLVTEAGSADTAKLAECVEHLLENFGPKRMMWGSDWPVCELVCSYEDWRQASARLLGNLNAAERELIHSGVARATYGI